MALYVLMQAPIPPAAAHGADCCGMGPASLDCSVPFLCAVALSGQPSVLYRKVMRGRFRAGQGPDIPPMTVPAMRKTPFCTVVSTCS